MSVLAVICEYNPLHNGHAKQLAVLRGQGAAVCLMSGDYVQRGEPAILDAGTRARAAMRCGANLVLELPLTYTLRSAEGFGDGAVSILNALGCVDTLCFGSEQGSKEDIMSTAKQLRTEEFSLRLREELKSGVSFPVARARAISEQDAQSAQLLRFPNATLGVEYCKALLKYESAITPLVLRRDGDYHSATQKDTPSATVLRGLPDWTGYVPEQLLPLYAAAPRYTLAAGERALLSRLRFMTQSEFEALPFGTEGLWRKLMAACRTCETVEAIVNAAKSKRYTRTRLMRMLLCAYLGITDALLNAGAPYVRVLAADEVGQGILRRAKKQGTVVLINRGQRAPDTAYSALERRAADLYSLFITAKAPPVGRSRTERIVLTK